MEFDEGWKSMEINLEKLKRIIEGSPESFDSQEYMDQYTKVYIMCTHGYGERLYIKYKEFIDDYIQSTVIPSLRDKRDEIFFREVAKRWDNHKLLSGFFEYVDRSYVYRRCLPTMMEAGLRCFRSLDCGEWKATRIIIDMIDRERDETLVDMAFFKQVVGIYLEIDMDHYTNDFEKAMLDGADAYYSRKASQWIVEDSYNEYMIKVEECLKKEKARVARYMHSSSEVKLLERVTNQLVKLRSEELLMKGNFRVLLRDENMEDLSRMSGLFEKVPNGKQMLADGLKQFASDEGMVLIKEADDAMSNKAEKSGAQAMELVVKTIELHDKFSGYVADCFSGQIVFQKAVKEAFNTFCNKTAGGGMMAEMLALYCDDVLRKAATEKLSSEAAKEILDKAVSLLAYINEMDLFTEFYRKKLTCRLLFERSPQYDHERFALSKLKQHFSIVFTSKLEGMVTDMVLAQEKQTFFKKYLDFAGSYNLGMDFAVTAITAVFWPSFKSCDLNLPKEMAANCIKAFKDYNEIIPVRRRKHTWIFSQGNCNIKGNFQNKAIELVVGTYQAVVLLLFNDAERLSFSEIKKQSNMEEDDLIRVLFSLSCAKYMILNKHPNTKSISYGDYFEFNSNFTNKMRRIKIPMPPPTSEERKTVVEDVARDRKHLIEAALVRIMKNRKVLGYQQLIAECVQQLSKTFKPEVRDIKKRIEDLITRDYLERDAENPNIFKYLA